MSFFEAVSSCLSQYATFRGRATRAEFWWFFLFVLLASLIIQALFMAFAGPLGGSMAVLAFGIAMLLPSLAVGARRLHDMDYSGWWQLLHLIGIGTLVLWIWMMFPGSKDTNRFGPACVDPDALSE